MDFNPLDLLASAALDNRSAQQEIHTDSQHQHPDDTQDEDDEEADASESDSSQDIVLPASSAAVSIEPSEDHFLEMGSVKNVKRRKALAKCTTLVKENFLKSRKKFCEGIHPNLTVPLQSSKMILPQENKIDEEEKVMKVTEKGIMTDKSSDASFPLSKSGLVHLCNGKGPKCSPKTLPVLSNGQVNSEDNNSANTKLKNDGDFADVIDSVARSLSDSVMETDSAESSSVASETQTPTVEERSNYISALENGLNFCQNISGKSHGHISLDVESTNIYGDRDAVLTKELSPSELCKTDDLNSDLIETSGIKKCCASTDVSDFNFQVPSAACTRNASDHSSLVNSVRLDHSYTTLRPWNPVDRPSSTDTTEDSMDTVESADEKGSVEDIDNRPRSLSVDSTFLQYGLPGTPTSREAAALSLNSVDKMSILSPTSSVDSLSNDSAMSENSSVPGLCYSILHNNFSGQKPFEPSHKHTLGSVSYVGVSQDIAKLYSVNGSSAVDHPHVTPKCGRKFRIGTFASFSSSNMDIDQAPVLSENGEIKLKIGIPDAVMKTSLSSPALVSPSSPFQLLQSPGMEWDRSDAGSEMQDDIDSTSTEDRFLSSSHGSESSGFSNLIWNHPVYHDHDYCSKDSSEKMFGKPVAQVWPMKIGKRKYTKKREKLLESAEDAKNKLKRAKYLKRELLKQDNRFSLPGTFENRMALKASSISSSFAAKPNPVGRPRKKAEKPFEEDIDPETGTKMKITGKFQDQYVYYLSKTSHNRRRKSHENTSHPSSDRIILPVPKPGDIVVPHLSDAEIEAIRHGGRAALKKISSGSSSSTDHFVDVDSKIVNTILSMENDSLGSPATSQDSDITDSIGLYEEQPCTDSLGFMGEKLTPDQVDLLLSVVKDVEVPSYSLDTVPKLASSQSFDFLAPAASSVSLNSLAPTTVEKDLDVAQTLSETETDDGRSSPSPAADAIDRNVVTQVGSNSPFCQAVKPLAESDKNIYSSTIPPTSSPMSTFDKSLDLFGGDFRSELFPDAAVPAVTDDQDVSTSTSAGDSTSSLTSDAADSSDTPWIVTVTIYWNDVPAIIISNQPYVRLVDIHKQILPAKDTGILKKRCQLMNIPVLNCTDMQRYFLVQYGRAYNSKSTLVVTKDEAKELIRYYVDPQPRVSRADDGNGILKRSASLAELSASPDTISSHPSAPSPRRRGGFRRRVAPFRSQNPSPELSASVTPAVGEPSKEIANEVKATTVPSQRLRHKKINFLELLKGTGEDVSPPVSLDSEHKSEDSLVQAAVIENSSRNPSSRKRNRSKEFGSSGITLQRHSRKGSDPQERKRNGDGRKTPVKNSDLAVRNEESDSESTAPALKFKRQSSYQQSVTSSSAVHKSKGLKFGPLKVKLKGLLNINKSVQSKKSSLFAGRKILAVGMSSVSRPLRVLKIAHLDAKPDAEGETTLSQIAEVHLDLYKRRSSLCIKCCTCKKFLSLPNFLQHQHLPSDSQSLTMVKHRQVLVPMNKENISLEEEHLWNEFLRLQKRLDHALLLTASLDDPSQSKPRVAQDRPLCQALDNTHHTNSVVNVQQLTDQLQDSELCNGNSERLDIDVVCGFSPQKNSAVSELHKDCLAKQTIVSPPSPVTHTEKEEKNIGCQTEKELSKVTLPQQQHAKVSPAVSVRTSSRKRKVKQFFSIENYAFARRNSKLESNSSIEENVDSPDNDSTLDNGLVSNSLS